MNHNSFCSYCEQPIYPSQKYCGTCGNRVAEPKVSVEPIMQNANDGTELLAIQLKQPYLIGEIPLKTLLYCRAILYISIIVFVGHTILKSWEGMIGLIWCVGYWLETYPAREKKRCPYCNEKNVFYVENSEQSCASCHRKVLLKWEQ